MEERFASQLAILGHPARLDLFRLLMRRYPDAVSAGEIAKALDVKPSTLSAYLGALEGEGLITHRRAGTSLFYQVSLTASEALLRHLFFDCCRGRADLCLPVLPRSQPKGDIMTQRPFNVLFICVGNSARSIMAEALLRDLGQGRFVAHSAGTKPYSELNPFTLDLLAAKGHDLTPLRAKHISEYQGADAPVMDFVFTVCDLAANEDCPAWPGQPISAHWGLVDPVKAEGSDAQRALAFQHTYGALRNRLSVFCALPFAQLDRMALQKAVDDIAALPNQEETQ